MIPGPEASLESPWSLWRSGSAEANQRMLALGRAVASLAAGGDAQAAYRRLFTAPAATQPPPEAAFTGPAWLRWQQAMQEYGRLATAIAADAAGRLACELQREAPDAPPVTSLRALLDLWIDCGERAWAAAARTEEFSAAQAELLHALAELRREAKSS